MLIYVEGPGDIVALHRKYQLDQYLSEMHTMPFSAQVFDVCNSQKHTCLAISTCAHTDSFTHQNITSINIPRHTRDYTGLRYHLAGIAFSMQVLAKVTSKRIDYLLISNATIPWYMLWLFRPFCRNIIGIHHNTLSPQQNRPQSTLARLVSFLDTFCLTRFVSRHFVVSDRIAAQLTKKRIASATAIVRFKPLFNSSIFTHSTQEKPRRNGNLSLLYSGRIERDKGVLDLLKAIIWIRERSSCKIHLVIAGTGSFEQEARDFCNSAGIDSFVEFTGQISGRTLQRHYAAADLIIAPTQSTFSEGYAMVVPEAILAGTGAIVSSVVPAADDFPECVVIIDPDDHSILGNEILQMIGTGHYSELSRSTTKYFNEILNTNDSLRTKLSEIIRPAGT